MSMTAAIKCNRQIYKMYQDSMAFSYGQHKYISQTPLVYMADDSYKTYQNYMKIAYHYKAMVQSKFNQLHNTKDYYLKGLKRLVQQFQDACPINFTLSTPALHYLADIATNGTLTEAFNTPLRVFDYQIVAKVNQIYRYLKPQGVECTVTGHGPNKHDLWGTRQFKFIPIKPMNIAPDKQFEPTDNLKDYQSQIPQPLWQDLTSRHPVSSEHKQYAIGLVNYELNSHRLPQALIKLPKVTKVEYDRARQILSKEPIKLPNRPTYWTK